MAATERAIPLASKQNLNISIVGISVGKDPDELVRSDKKAWQEAIEKPTYALDWLISYYKSKTDLSSAPGKRRFSDLILPIIQSLSDDVEQDHYINQIAKLLDIDPNALRSKLITLSDTKQKRLLTIKSDGMAVNKKSVEKLKTQDSFLCLMLMNKALRDSLKLVKREMLVSDDAKKLLELLLSNSKLDVKKDEARFKSILNYVKIEMLLYEELYLGLDTTELKYEAVRLRVRLAENYIKDQKTILTKQLLTANSQSSRKLLEKAKELDNLLNQVSGR